MVLNRNFPIPKVTMKKLTTMTPLQIISSFQTWNAKPISDILHDKLEEVVSSSVFEKCGKLKCRQNAIFSGKVEALLKRGIDPNAVAARGALPGSVPGSTPAVFLAATRGYWRVRRRTGCNRNRKMSKQTFFHLFISRSSRFSNRTRRPTS